MGGLGSGRHWGCGKATVEDGLTLDINKLVRDGNIRPAGWCSGTLTWRRVSSGKEIGNIGYEVNLMAPYHAWVRLNYRVNDEPQDLRITLDFQDAPLATIIDYIREVSDLNIFVDTKVRDMDLVISMKVQEISVGSVLKLMLSPHGCDALYREGVLMIMTKEDIQDRTVKLELYDCRDILYPIVDFPGVDIQLQQDQLGVVTLDAGDTESEPFPIEELVRAHTGGTSWDDNAKASVTLQNGILIVKNSPPVHKQVIHLLNMLRRNK